MVSPGKVQTERDVDFSPWLLRIALGPRSCAMVTAAPALPRNRVNPANQNARVGLACIAESHSPEIDPDRTLADGVHGETITADSSNPTEFFSRPGLLVAMLA